MKPHFQKLPSLLAALSCTICNSFAQEEAPPLPAAPPPAKTPAETDSLEAQIGKLFEELGDEDFRTRENATMKLWIAGDKAEPFVREAMKSDDIELRTRAAHLLSLFRFGIYPDTPADQVALINQFRHGDIRGKTIALQQLYTRGAINTVSKLIRSVDSKAVRSKLVRSVVEGLDEKIAELFASENYDDVESLLVLAAISDEGLRDLAAFHLHRGSLEDQIGDLIERGKESKLTPLEYEQLSWFYRVRGDLDRALAAADEAENPALENNIRIAQGDLITLIKTSFNPNDRTIEAYGFTAAHQRLSGDTAGFEDTVKTIKEYAAENPDEERQCVEALLINGRITDAINISSRGSSTRLQLLIDNGEHLRALAELGIDDSKPPYPGCLDSLVEEFKAAETSAEYATVLNRAYTLARLLKGWGESTEAERIFRTLGGSTGEANPEFMPRLIANASVLGLHDVALEFTRAAFEREAADAEIEPGLPGLDLEEDQIRNQIGQRGVEESLIASLYWDEAESAGYWWTRLQEVFPNDNSLGQLERLDTLLDFKGDNRAASLELLADLVPHEGDEIDEEDLMELLSRIGEAYLRNNEIPQAMGYLKRALEMDRAAAVNANNRYASILAADGKWQEAAPYFKAAADGAPTNPYCLVRYGIALERSGNQAEAANLIRRAHLLALGRPVEFFRIADAFATSKEFARALEATQMILNIALPDDSIAHRAASNLADLLYYQDPERSALYNERFLVECLNGHVPLPTITSASSTRGSIGSLRARSAISAGRIDEAVENMRALIDHQPSNSSLIEDLYPILVEAGRQKEADEFYEKLNQYGEDALALFPKSAQDLNSNAWLKSRCGKDLDTALERSARSNELSKNNFAYIDTLAEVYFQKGERDEAVKLSEQAVRLSGSGFLLSHQLERFKTAKPLSERLPK